MIPARLSITAAAARRWDAIVVGAGPGGAAAALHLALAGRRVLLVERSAMPRGKVCGCCLSPLAIRELAAVSGDIAAAAIPLQRVRLVASRRESLVAMDGGATLSREALDTRLVETAVAAGAAWLPLTSIRSIVEDDAGVLMAADGDGSLCLRADSAVIATGLSHSVRVGSRPSGSTPASGRRGAVNRIGLGLTLPATAGDVPPGELVMAVARGGYVGVVRLEDGRIDVAAAVDPDVVSADRGPAAALAAMLADAGPWRVDLAAVRATAVRATPRLTHRQPLHHAPFGRVLRIGDAAGYVEPFTGEGIGWALVGARLAAVALTSAPQPRAAARRYETDYRRALRRRQARCRGVALAVRHPGLVAGVVRLAGLAPAAAVRILPWIVGGGRGA